jgi:hypothetical protein
MHDPKTNTIDGSWANRLGELLVEAATLGVAHELDVDAFMQGAWRAYLDARPGLKEHLEEMQLLTQLEAARESGRIAKA